MCNDKNAYSYMYTILLYWYIKWKNMMWKHIREENTYDYDIMILWRMTWEIVSITTYTNWKFFISEQYPLCLFNILYFAHFDKKFRYNLV